MRHPALSCASVLVLAAACSSGSSGSAPGTSNGGTSNGSTSHKPGSSTGGSGGADAGNSGGTSAGGSGNASSSGGSGNTGAGGSTSTAYDCQNPGPGWLFCEDFEGMAAGFDAWKAHWGWTDSIGASDPGRMTSSTDAHTGKYAVYYPAAASSGYKGADLIYRTCDGANKAGCALKSYDQLYFRTYVKLAADHERVHHFLNISGSQQFWDAYGNAGCRPNGSRAMGTTVDFAANTHNTFFYTYYPEMNCDPGATCDKYADSQAICDGCAKKGMPCSNGPECCWGNWFKPAQDVPIPTGKWVCMEMMMKANDVGQKNGEMAYWVDGKLADRETGMHFRNTADLGLNMVRLQHYLETSDAKSHSNRVWFDDVVVSTQRIGCM
jgi:hypothetical protein